MSCTRADEFNMLLIIYSSVAFLSILRVFGKYEMWALKLLAIYLTLAHIHYGICIVSLKNLIKKIFL